ncbi:MAG: hypothetical protein N3D75_03935 [Candidatus Aenigmarchaeota archaeon]|nr:hypothetical protein [Candidatus Aenigmarchaeota archaeon]
MKNSNAFAIVMTTLLLALVIFTSPTYGINLSALNLAGIHTKSSMVNFAVQAMIETPEHVPVNYLNITFIFPDASTKTCQIMLNSSIYGCDFIYVNSIKTSNLSYGYGYGYANQGFDLGYGYGYFGQGSILFDLTLDTNKLDVGNYNANIILYTGIHPKEKSFSTSQAFSIVQQASSSGSSGSVIRHSLSVDVSAVKNTISIRIKNSGLEDMDRVYVYIPQTNYTSEPFELKVGEEVILNYTVENHGTYVIDVHVIGENENARITRQKSVEIIFAEDETIEASQQEQQQEIEKTESKELQSQPITGLVMLTQLTKYWYLGLIVIAGILLFAFRRP